MSRQRACRGGCGAHEVEYRVFFGDEGFCGSRCELRWQKQRTATLEAELRRMVNAFGTSNCDGTARDLALETAREVLR